MLSRLSWELAHKRAISTPNPTLRGSTLFVCLSATNLPNSTNSMGEVTQNNMLHTLLMCNNAGTGSDSLVKQFVRTLKGIAFDWDTDVLPESIDS